ncbi:MAG: N-acetyltransferase [Lachnospiraceae bacterium]|nr:N-acetyltransferase [Lachnospiraceae bacterium]
MGDISFRKAEEKDLQRLTDIYNAAVRAGCNADSEEYTKEQRVPWFLSHDTERFPLYVCLEDGEVIGYGSLSEYRFGRKRLSGTAELSYYLDREKTGRGIGTKLLGFLIEKARELEFDTLLAMILGSNRASRRILEKSGFSQWGRIPDAVALDDGRTDHVIYGLKL